MVVKIQNFINGKYEESSKFIDSINPATGKINAKVPDSLGLEVDLAVKAATAAFESWAQTSRIKRSAIMNRIADLIEARIVEFATAESMDQGKPLSVAMSVDIPRAIYNFRFFASAILHQQERTSELDGVAYSYVVKDPVGVAALISPWNLPLYLLTWKIAPCIAYGCTCVCKPSEYTSVTAYMLCDVLNEAGLPAGVVNMIFGTGPNAGSPLINHPDVPLLSFTGGTQTGKLIYEAGAKLNKKLSLELGGKNANIIFADCNFDEALENSVRSSFANQGEICLCGSRIFVQREIFDRFVNAMVDAVAKITVGDPLTKVNGLHIGALVSKQHMEKVLSYIQIAREEGGKIHCGGERLMTDDLQHGYFVPPTIITGIPPVNCRVQKEEIFGPVVTIVPFDTEEEVILFANSTQYGLSASVYSENGRKATRVARALKVGTVWINTWMTRDLNMPFGGQKMSGLGREGGCDSVHFFCEDKTICNKL